LEARARTGSAKIVTAKNKRTIRKDGKDKQGSFIDLSGHRNRNPNPVKEDSGGLQNGPRALVFGP
jgi:hypothetical protein